MTDDTQHVTQEEFRRLLALARGQQPRKGGFVRFLGDVCQMLLFAGAIVGGYFLLQIFIGAPAALPPVTNAQGSPLPTYPPQRPAQPPVAAPVVQPPGALPSCAVVTDTRTACQPVADAPAIAAEPLPTEPPAPTATPAYMTACWTEPGERPCWLPADAPWTPMKEAPATPLVAVEETWHAPMIAPADVCADWRPPAPWPEECNDE